MCAVINNPASCEVRAVIRFLLARNNNAAVIHRQLCEVYGPNVMNESKVRQWSQSSSPKAKKFKQEPSVRKIMATVLWDRKGILLIDLLERGLTTNADAYRATVRKLRRAVQNKRRGMLSSGIVLLRDNARPHTAARTAQLLQHFRWEALWSSGQSFWLQIQRSRVRSPALPDFLSSSGSGTGSTQPREVKLRSYLNKKVAAPGSENRD